MQPPNEALFFCEMYYMLKHDITKSVRVKQTNKCRAIFSNLIFLSYAYNFHRVDITSYFTL